MMSDLETTASTGVSVSVQHRYRLLNKSLLLDFISHVSATVCLSVRILLRADVPRNCYENVARISNSFVQHMHVLAVFSRC